MRKTTRSALSLDIFCLQQTDLIFPAFFRCKLPNKHKYFFSFYLERDFYAFTMCTIFALPLVYIFANTKRVEKKDLNLNLIKDAK